MQKAHRFGIGTLMAIVPVLLMAQSDRGTITGTVADPAGALVPGAPLILGNRSNLSNQDD